MGVFLLLAIIFFASTWVFNHVNPWLGILMIGITGFFIGQSIVKLVEKDE